MTIVGVSALTAVLVGAGATPAQAGPGPRFGENYVLPAHSAARSRDVPGLAVDPADQNHIVEAEIDPVNLQCDYNVSFDGGRSWSGGHLTAVDPGLNPPFPTPACDQNFDSGGYAHFNTGIVFGSGSNVYVTFSVHRGAFNRPESDLDGGNGDDSVVARSTDGGVTFQAARIAVPGGGPVAGQAGLAGFGMRPALGVERGAGDGGQDRLYVSSWNCFIRVRTSQAATGRGGCSGGGGDRRIFVTRSDDAGTTWNAPVLVSAANVRSGAAVAEAGSADEQAREPSQPVVGPDGSIYVAYRNRDITNGVTCPANPAITTPTPLPGAFARNLAHCIVVSRSTDHGRTWQQFSTNQPISPGTLSNPRLAIDPATPGGIGTLYVVYQRPVGADPSDISIQRSSNRGQTWSGPVRVNDDPAGTAFASNFIQTNPYVTVGPGGRVDVVWGDKRHTYPGAGDYGDVYYARSTNGATTFAANRRVTDRTTNFDIGRAGDTGSSLSPFFSWYGPVSVPLANGDVLSAFLDSRNGNVDSAAQDIFLSRLSDNAPLGGDSIATATTPGLSVRLSRLAYPGGGEGVLGEPTTRVVVASDSDPAGALVGSVLARASFGPLLITPTGGLPAIVKAEAARIGPVGAYVIGGTGTVSGAVTAGLSDTTRNGENVTRIAAPATVPAEDRPADVARQVAELMRPLSTPTAVVVNPATPEATAAAGLAAALRIPILFVDGRDTVPPPTAAAIGSLGITEVLIVGGTGSVPAATAADLGTMATTVTRLGGANVYATSVNVLAEARRRGLATNVVYVGDGARPGDAAVLASTAARMSNVMLLTPGADTSAAVSTLTTLGLDASVDRVVSAIGTGGTDPTLPPAAPGPAPPAVPGAPVAPPLVALSGLRASPSAFRAASSGGSVKTAAPGATGTRVSYSLNVAGSVRFVVERASGGRRVNGRCVKTTHANARRTPCLRYTRLTGGFTRTRSAGADRFTFTGRIGGRKLGRGRYRLVAIPSAAGRRGVTKRVSFRVTR